MSTKAMSDFLFAYNFPDAAFTEDDERPRIWFDRFEGTEAFFRVEAGEDPDAPELVDFAKDAMSALERMFPESAPYRFKLVPL